jgi:hypothetical protein
MVTRVEDTAGSVRRPILRLKILVVHRSGPNLLLIFFTEGLGIELN